MTTYTDDPDGAGRPLCPECAFAACQRPTRYICDDEHCGCVCRQDTEDRADRARELDNRPAAALANVARDMEAEARPDVAGLVAERFGRPTRGRA